MPQLMKAEIFWAQDRSLQAKEYGSNYIESAAQHKKVPSVDRHCILDFGRPQGWQQTMSDVV